MPLLNSLQSGYPAVQPGEGMSLLDLLRNIGASGNAPDAATPADKQYAAAASDADAQLGRGINGLLGAFIPPAQAANAPQPYAMGTQDPAAMNPSQGTGAPMGFGSAVIPQAPAAQPPSFSPSTAATAAPAPNAAVTPPFAAPQGALPSASVPAGNQALGAPIVVPDGDTSGTAGTSDAAPGALSGNAGGLLGMLGSQVSDAAQSPAASKGLLSQFADTAQSVSDKLKNLSPSASQALLASGLTILAGNDGTRNLGQLVGMGGIAGLNAYDSSRQQIAANSLAQQKLQQEATQQRYTNALDAQKLIWEQQKPVALSPGQSLLNPQNGAAVVQGAPQVARTTEVQGQDGNTYTVQLGNDGKMIGPPLLKQNPYVGPLNDSQQKTVNDAQAVAAGAVQTYQRTAQLAQALNTADFSGGVPAAINDTLTRITGSKDAGQQLRGQLAQFANSAILSELPPGSASDKDIQLVRNGVPSDTAGKDTWQAYLGAVGRIQQQAAVYSSAKADYAAANRGNFGPLMQPATVNGIQFPAGTAFADAVAGRQPQTQPQQQTQPSQRGGAVPFSTLQAEARRRGLIK